MKVTKRKKDKDTVSFTIEGELDIYSVKKIRDAILDSVDKIKNILFDLSAVNKIDTAGFQLLSAIRLEFKTKNKQFKIINPSTDVVSIFTLYGEEI